MKSHSPRLLRHVFTSIITAFLVVSLAITGSSLFLWSATAEAQGSSNAVLHRHNPLVQAAIEVQNRHTKNLMAIRDVVGTGVGMGADGLPIIKIFTVRAGVAGIPEWLESIPVKVEVTGMVFAFEDTTARYRPAPIGVSTGHPAITAGTIGARVKNSAGNVFALSNNHVYANQNDAFIGDSALQPGPYDGGEDPIDQIGELYDFEPIDFTFAGENYMDAAIALSSFDLLDNKTLSDGYGTPSSQIAAAAIGEPVKKYGRTTGLTHGEISAINAFIEVCYEQWVFFCVKSAYFFDQIQISSQGFSAGGDSGSLIVTENGNNPVGLLFAGSETTTFANRIDLVLNRFNVTVDGDEGPVPTPPTAPSNLTAAAVSTTQINLSWTDNSGDESGFAIERCKNTKGACANFAEIADVGAGVSSYQDTGLNKKTTYRYRVRAYNSSGTSTYSNIASGKTLTR